MVRASKIAVVCVCMLCLVACREKIKEAGISPDDFSKRHLLAAEYAAEIDSVRSSLAESLVSQVADAETFAQVCIPVRNRASELSERTGWQVKQMAVKYRNPVHKADAQAELVMQRFEESQVIRDVWERVVVDGESGWRYFAPIRVEESCLACHGDPDSRPDFVKDGYPEDKAFNFGVGDLRGLYSVFIPDSSANG